MTFQEKANEALEFVAEQIQGALDNGWLGVNISMFYDELAPSVINLIRKQGYKVEVIGYEPSTDATHAKYHTMITW